jgi:hypothetical protein
MSKGTRTRSKEKRQKEKQARKAAKTALYESYQKQGTNTKSKRFRQNESKTKLVTLESHPQGQCGNVGCEGCHPKGFGRYLNKDGSIRPGTPTKIAFKLGIKRRKKKSHYPSFLKRKKNCSKHLRRNRA